MKNSGPADTTTVTKKEKRKFAMESKNREAKEVKEVKTWRIATWNLHGGMLDPIKAIMVGDDLTKNKIDFVALQEVQSKEEKIQDLDK